MAVVNVKSTPITNSDGRPVIKNSMRVQNGSMEASVGVVAIASGDSVGSIYRVLRIRSSARIDSLVLSNDAIATGGAADVGLYRKADDGGAVVDADFFTAAMALQTAGNTEVLHGNAYTRAKAEQPIWQVLGLTSDPQVEYDVALTLTTASQGAGSVALKARFLIEGA